MAEINRDNFITLCEDAEIRYNTAYSGREMYGKSCIAIYGSPATLVKFLFQIVPFIDSRFAMGAHEDGGLDYFPEWEDLRTDDWFRGQVFYWPGIKAVVPETASATLL